MHQQGVQRAQQERIFSVRGQTDLIRGASTDVLVKIHDSRAASAEHVEREGERI